MSDIGLLFAEARDSLSFVGKGVEDSKDVVGRQLVLQALGQIEQLAGPAMVEGKLVAPGERTICGLLDPSHILEIQQEVAVALLVCFLYQAPQVIGIIGCDDPVDIENQYRANLPRLDFHAFGPPASLVRVK